MSRYQAGQKVTTTYAPFAPFSLEEVENFPFIVLEDFDSERGADINFGSGHVSITVASSFAS